jgi:hypothetical protein
VSEVSELSKVEDATKFRSRKSIIQDPIHKMQMRAEQQTEATSHTDDLMDPPDVNHRASIP